MTRVAITTDRFQVVAPLFSSLGLDPVAVPCIRFEPAGEESLASARAVASSADLVLITSVRTVELLWPDGAMPDVKVAAVGKTTAREVSAAGGTVVATGRSGLAGLIETIVDKLPTAGSVALLHGSGSDPAALNRLRGLVPTMDERLIYRTVPIAPAPVPVDAVVFASPSAVAGWLQTRRLDDLVVGVIGETTGAVVGRHVRPQVIASEPSHQSLARALAAHLEVKL